MGRPAARRRDAARHGAAIASRANGSPQTDGLAQNSVYAVYRARDGAVWAGTLSGGVSRIHKGRPHDIRHREWAGVEHVTVDCRDRRRQIWFGTPSGISAAHARQLAPVWHQRGPAGQRRQHALRGSAAAPCGPARRTVSRSWRAASSWRSRTGAPVLRGSILGIAADRAGWLWVATADRVVRGPSRGAPARARHRRGRSRVRRRRRSARRWRA